MKINNTKKISDTCWCLLSPEVNYYYFSEACNMLHRTSGPAIEFKTGESHYYLLGQLHRNDGAAIVTADGLKQYWLNGKQFETEEEYLKKIQK